MSTSDLLSSTVKWPGKGLYGLKSSVLQTSDNDLVKQNIISDHMRHHYRRLHGARSSVDTKPPKAMILGQKCRDRARKEMVQMVYTQSVLDQFTGTTDRSTPRGRSSQSARSTRLVQSQPTTARARSKSAQSGRLTNRSLTRSGSMRQLNAGNATEGGDIASKLFGGGALSQAFTAMAALGKMTSSERNKSSADVLDKHPDFFSQPAPSEHQPRLVKRDSASYLRNNRTYYNPPPARSKTRAASATEETPVKPEVPPNDEEATQLALSIRRTREQLNRSLEIRQNVEKKIKRAKATTKPSPTLKKHSDETLRAFGLSEQERLQYVRFMQDITDAILRKNLTTESAIEKLFEIHIDRNRGVLDERRLRDLLEALKEDLGVRSSRKVNTPYASVHRANAFDNEPLPPPMPAAPTNGKRRTSYDMNAPLPWQAAQETPKPPAITPRSTPHSRPNPSSDDHPFSPASITSVQATTPSSLPAKFDQHPHAEEILSTKIPDADALIPMNMNSTIRKPMHDLHNIDWLADTGPSRVTDEKASPLHAVDEDEHEALRRTLSPPNDDYDGADFDDDDHSEQ